MRLAFFFLVLVNLAFHVWSAGYLGGQNSGREPERLTQQINAEKIRVVAGHSPVPASIDRKISASECRLVSGLSSEQAANVEKNLAGIEGLAISIVQPTAVTMHWVLIRNLPSRSIADKKVAELRQLGVDDSRIVHDQVSGPLIVSLGIFSSDKAAQDHLANLNKKGVRSAVIEPREQAGQKAAIEIRAATELLARLPEALAPYVAASVSDCAVGGQ